jgi:hypothetical protein
MIIALNCDDNEITFNKKNYLLRAARRLDWGIVGDIKEIRPPYDYILNIQPCTLLMGKKWTGLWHIDILLNSYIPANEYGLVDTVFVASTHSQCLNTYNKALTLFQACDPVLHRRIPEIKPEFDYVLCGSMGVPIYEQRENMHKLLRDKYTYGDFGKNHKPEEYVAYLNKGRVQWVRSGTGPHGKSNIAQRFFESLAIGPVLTNWTDDLLATGLIEGEDYLAYHDGPEMMGKMEKLISDEKYRNYIAENGRKKALMYHSYEQRLMAIFNIVNEFTFGSAQ